MLVVAVANQKGGVGKTTCCINLGAALGQMGFNVLVVDMDPQGNCTSGLGVDRGAVERSIYHVLVEGVPLEDVVRSTPWKGMAVVPATIDLAGAEVELVGALSRETRLARPLEKVTGYDVALIDCPPSLGLLTVNALVAAHRVLVPLQCEYYALEGIGQLLRTLDLIRGYLNEDLTLGGIVLTMFDPRTRLAREVVEEARNSFAEKVFATVIPRNVRLSEAPSFGEPILYYDAASSGAEAYRELGKEVAHKWLEKP